MHSYGGGMGHPSHGHGQQQPHAYPVLQSGMGGAAMYGAAGGGGGAGYGYAAGYGAPAAGYGGGAGGYGAPAGAYGGGAGAARSGAVASSLAGYRSAQAQSSMRAMRPAVSVVQSTPSGNPTVASL